MNFSMRPLLVLALTSAFVLQFASFARAQEEEDDADQAGRNVRLDGGTIARLGIETTKIQMAQYRSETSGFGVVIAFDTLAQVDSDLTTAEVATENSAAAAFVFQWQDSGTKYSQVLQTGGESVQLIAPKPPWAS